ncbi:serine hydrolase [Nonomuraea sp. LPB2021202275-12-8]|uniref:serine hydrolase n=1 Tax=Nonomuraea sp. LPB2021202275-12-8 TaxID=3120159 RepID=UPI00300C8A2A
MSFPAGRGASRIVAAGCALLLTASVLAQDAVPPQAKAEVSAMIPATPQRPGTTAKSTSPSFSKAERRKLSRALDRYLSGEPGRLSVAVRDLATGLGFSYNTRLRPATASVVKVNIVVALLLQVQRRRRALTSGERRLAARAVKVSDNDAASTLWNTIGGASGLAAANRRLGLRSTRPGPAGAWGATTTSAADQVRLLRALTSTEGPLTGEHRRYVLRLMRAVAPEQAWGVSAAAREGSQVALKNGWLPRPVDGGLWTVNSIGRVRSGDHDHLIAVVSDRHTSMRQGIEAVERVAKTVTAALSAASDV